MKQKVIIIRGPSGVGKSSVSHSLANLMDKKIKRLAYLPVDVSIYPLMKTHSKLSRKERADIMQENLELLLNNFLKRGFSAIIDGIFDRKYGNKFSLDRLHNIAKKNGARTFVVEMHASINILHKRIDERVRKNPNAWRDRKLTEERYNRFMKTRYKRAIWIETENKSIDEIAKEIFSKIK